MKLLVRLSLLSIMLLAAYLANAQTNVYGSYLFFNGQPETSTGDYIEVPDDSSLDFDASQSFTIQFWINPINFSLAAGTRQGIVTKRTRGGRGWGVFWEANSNGVGRFRLRLRDQDPTATAVNFRSTNIADPNSLGWTHVTFVFERNAAPAEDTAYVYFDGILNRKRAAIGIDDLTNTRPVRLMNYFNNTSDLCAGGRLDEVRIWNKALTVRQIQRFYAEPIARNNSSLLNGKVISTFTGKRSFLLDWSSLAAYWDMEESPQVGTVTDKSDNSNNGQFFEGSTSCSGSPCGPDFRNFGQPGHQPKETFVSIATGNWGDASTWSGGNIPDSDRAIVFIKDGYTVTVNGTFTVEDLNIENGSTIDAAPLSLLQVVKYMHIDGSLNCIDAGSILFDQVGSHWIYGEGDANFFNFGFFQNSQVTVDTENNTPVNIYGVLEIGDGRLVTNDNVVLKVNKSNSNRPYGLVSPIGVGIPDVRGTIIMEKQLSGTNAGWRQMCMPLKGTLNDFIGLTINDNSFPATQQNVFFWNSAQDASIPANNVGWTSASINSGHGKPYSIYLDDGDFSFNPTLTFEGEYNFGDTSYNVTYFNDPGNPLTAGTTGYENGVGWNFIPNRYPSLLDVAAMVNDNPLTYPNIHVWDANTQQYISFLAGNSATVIPYNNDPGVAANNSSFNGIEPFQGFWVKTTDLTEAGNTPFVVKDSYRSVSFANLSVAPTLKTSNYLQLNVFAQSDSTWDGVSISFNPEATNSFNPQREAYKLLSNGNVPSLFAAKNKKWLTVMDLPATAQTATLAFMPKKIDDLQTYFLNLDASKFTRDARVILEDLATGAWHDFETGSYAFHASNPQDEASRFRLHFINKDAPFNGLNKLENIGAFATAGSLVVQSSAVSGLAQVTIFDITGRLLASAEIELGTDAYIDAPDINGVVLVRVTTQGETKTIKLTVTK